jgi:hypothetical protein
LWELDPRAMAAAVARHDGIIATAVADADGALLKAKGKGYIHRVRAPAPRVGEGLDL